MRFTACAVFRIAPRAPSIAVGGFGRPMHAYRVTGTGGAVVREPTDRSESDSAGTGQARQLDMHLFGFFHHFVHWSFSVLLFDMRPPIVSRCRTRTKNLYFSYCWQQHALPARPIASLHDDMNSRLISKPL